MMGFGDAPIRREGQAVEYDTKDSRPIFITKKQPNGLYQLERHEFMVGGKVIASDLTLDEIEALMKVKGEE